MKYNIKSMAYILPILIFAPVYNIPRFFELESKPGGPNENTTLSCRDGDETFEVEDQFLIEHVIKSNESIWNKWGIQCIKNNPYLVDYLVLTETRKDKLYISVTIFFVFVDHHIVASSNARYGIPKCIDLRLFSKRLAVLIDLINLASSNNFL